MFTRLKKSQRTISALLLFCFSMMVFAPNMALAKDNEEKEPQKSESTMVEVVAKYVNAIGGTEIINTDKYSVDKQEQDPQKIEGWVYDDYDESVDYVYVPKDVPYIMGYPDKTVRPLRYISRCEATAVFSRLYDGDYPKKVRTYKKGTFKDVPENHWAYDDIVKMYESGIITGDAKKFHPEEPISRAELAALAVRFNPDKFTSDEDGESPFKDVKDGKWYSDEVLLAASNEWIKGYPDHTFKPEESVTRTETMAIINRVLQRQITAERLNEVGASNPYTDIKASDWYYADAIEATIKHDTEIWHEPDFNNGAYNVIEQDFVDKDGNVLAKHKQVKGKEVKAPKEIAGFKYLGYVKHAKFIYKEGTPKPSITKASNAEGNTEKKFFPGTNVTYKIIVSNDTKATRWMENAVVTDDIPADVTYNEGSVTIDGKQAKDVSIHRNDDKKIDKIKVELGKVGIGEEKIVEFTCKINEDTYEKEIKNTAYVKADNMEDELKAEDEGFVVPKGYAKLVVEKEAKATDSNKDVSKLKAGDKVEYTISVTADKLASDTKAKNVVVTDTLDEFLKDNVDNVRVNDSNKADYTYKDRVLKVNLGDIKKGETKKITFTATISDEAFDETIKNVGIAIADNADEQPSNPAVIQTVDGDVELSIDKEAYNEDEKLNNGDKVNAGDNLDFIVTVKNSRNSQTAAKDIVVQDTLDKYFHLDKVFVDDVAISDYGYTDRVLTVNIDQIDKGESVKIRICGKVDKEAFDKEIKNVAKVNCKQDPKFKDSNEVIVNTNDGIPERGVVKKTVDKQEVKPGEKVTYTIEASNNQSATKELSLKITDNIPEGMILDTGSIQATNKNGEIITGTYKLSNGDKTITLMPVIPVNDTITYRFTVVVPKGTLGGTVFRNVAVVEQEGREPSDVPAPDVTVHDGDANPYVTKTVDKKEAHNGDTVKYTIIVENKEGKDAYPWKNVEILDQLPIELEYVGGEPTVNGNIWSDSSRKDQTIKIQLGDIAVGESKVIEYSAKVRENTQDEIVLKSNLTDKDKAEEIKQHTLHPTNDAYVHGTNGADRASVKVDVPPIIKEEEAEKGPDDVVMPAPNLIVTKTASKSIVDMQSYPDGCLDTFTIKVENIGDADATEVLLTDELDNSRLTFVANSVKIDGVLQQYPNPNGSFNYDYKTHREAQRHMLSVPLGTIKPGEVHEVEFTVKFAPDRADEPYVNKAVATAKECKGEGYTTVTLKNAPSLSKMHERLFNGFEPDGTWHPEVDTQGGFFLSTQEAAAIIKRSMTMEARAEVLSSPIHTTVPQCLTDAKWTPKSPHPYAKKGKNPHFRENDSPYWYVPDLEFMYKIGGLAESDFDYSDPKSYNAKVNYQRLIATRKQIGNMLTACGMGDIAKRKGFSYNAGYDHLINRYDFASEICKITGRDEKPNFNSLEVNTFPDISENPDLPKAVSTYHEYIYLDENGHELWIYTDKGKKPLE